MWRTAGRAGRSPSLTQNNQVKIPSLSWSHTPTFTQHVRVTSSVHTAPPSCPHQFVPTLMYLWFPLQGLRLLHTYVGHKSAIEKDSGQEEGEMEKSVGGRVSA